MQLRKNNLKAIVQSTLNGLVEVLPRSMQFTREGVLHAVTQLVACDDQVSLERDLKSGSCVSNTSWLGTGAARQVLVLKLPHCNEAAGHQI